MLCQVGKGRKSAAQSHTTNAVLLHRPQVQGRTANASLVKDANERELLSGHLCSQHSNLHLQCTYFRGTSVQETAGSLATEAGSQQGSSLHLGSWYLLAAQIFCWCQLCLHYETCLYHKHWLSRPAQHWADTREKGNALRTDSPPLLYQVLIQTL